MKQRIAMVALLLAVLSGHLWLEPSSRRSGMKQRIAIAALLLAVLSGYLWLQSHPQGEAV